MRRDEFHYELPPELIAQHPSQVRGDDRLLCLKGDGQLEDRRFADLPGLLNAGDLLVFNDTKVIPARLFGQKPTGGQVEIMLERVLNEQRFLAQLRVSKPPKPGSRLLVNGGFDFEVIEKQEDMFVLGFEGRGSLMDLFEKYGHMPLPPYIERSDEASDRERYQTIYASRSGAVAAPTAGLHFTNELLDELKAKGVQKAFVTLHVGAGTFQPVRVEEIEDHRMHSEFIDVPTEVCEQVNETRARGKRVIAVGTTAVRCLETAGTSGKLRPYCGETDIFIYPGYRFRQVDALLTNFHLPESTLLMLVCAFAGTEPVLAAYRHAIAEKYQFYSYGDAMLLTPDRLY